MIATTCQPKQSRQSTQALKESPYYFISEGRVLHRLPMNSKLNEGGLVLEFCVAGYEKSQLQVDVQDQSIWIEGKALDNREDPSKMRKGFNSGNFRFGYQIDQKYDLRKMEVSLRNGILTVEVKKRPDWVRSIEVK
jgi:HSP20 family molecular chaperone IbpA